MPRVLVSSPADHRLNLWHPDTRVNQYLHAQQSRGHRVQGVSESDLPGRRFRDQIRLVTLSESYLMAHYSALDIAYRRSNGNIAD